MDEICSEFGPPEYVETEDGEGWYWRFAGYELPVGDHLSDIIQFAAEKLSQRATPEPSRTGEQAWNQIGPTQPELASMGRVHYAEVWKLLRKYGFKFWSARAALQPVHPSGEKAGVE